MKNFLKVLCIVLAVSVLFGLAACNPSTPSNESSAPATESNDASADASQDESAAVSEDPGADLVDIDALAAAVNVDELLPTEGDDIADVDEYTINSREAYKAVLDEFYRYYQVALAENETNLRYVKMAVAEAKLMEACVMVPTTTQGGNYAIGRVAPYTVTNVMWGNDSDRFHQVLVSTELMKPEDRNEIKAKWGELKGTGEFEAWAKKFLADKGYTLKDTYSIGYSSDPQTWDALATSRAADSEAIVNTYDGLVEYNIEGILSPALAESWTISDDGLTYTFKIRSGAVWTDVQGRKVDDVKAQDWVDGIHHLLDAAGGLESLIAGKVAGVAKYLEGTGSFDDVGVKAPDASTLVITLEAPCSYFMTMLTYNIFAPMSRTFFESKGGKFGDEYDPKADTYLYGTSPENIAYCGPYLVANATEKNTIVFKANDSYWNKDNINIKTINWYFNDGSDALKAYNDMKAGVVDAAGLNASALEQAKIDGLYDEYHYLTGTNATSFMGFLNVNRARFTNIDAGAGNDSPKTDDQKEATKKAMLNEHFRRAFCMAFDRATYNAQSTGEELKYVALRNSYTPGTFAMLDKEVTVKLAGKEVTYPVGTYYGKIMQDQIDADGVKIKVWDPTADDGVGSSDGFDGWYNAANAAEEMAKAVEELKADGLDISAENPIYIDYCLYDASTRWLNQGNVLKKAIEEALGKAVIVNLNSVTQEQFYYAGYYTEYGNEANYDFYDLSGWGPDWGDPSTYLDTFLPEFDGYMAKCIGVY